MRQHWIEEEHPRWPAKAPAGKGGQFRERVGGGVASWIPQVAGRRQMSFEEVLDYVDRTDFEDEEMLGGYTARTWVREYPDGTRLVLKNTPWQNDAIAEIEASLIGRAIGAPVPTVVPLSIEDDEVLMEYVVGMSAGAHFASGLWGNTDVPDPRRAFYDRYVDSDPAILLGLLDLIGGNTDRNMGNWKINPLDGTPRGIDHSQMFDPDAYDYADDSYIEGSTGDSRPPWTDSEFALKHFIEGVDSRRYKSNPMHPEDIDLAVKRIKHLYEVGLIREQTWNLVAPALAEVRAHAKGTKRRIL